MISIEIRFWQKVEIPADPLACWNWTGALRNGYGAIGLGGRYDGIEYAHRWSFFEHSGFLADGEEVCHSCDNRRCVNPYHLYAGTRKDNMEHCSRVRRHVGTRGQSWGLINGKRVYSDCAA